MLHGLKKKICVKITVVDKDLHQCSIIRNDYATWYKIMADLMDSDPSTIITMCQKRWLKWKEIPRVKIHGTLLDMTLKKGENFGGK